MAAPQTVKFAYSTADDAKRLAVSGVIGGMTPHGLLLANVFFEKHRLPREQTGIVHPDGRLEITAGPPSEPVIEREIVAGLVMTPEVALSVAQWISDTAHAAIAARTPPTPPKTN
jgi:hypothetical protein